MYVITRLDLNLAQQSVQAMHAAMEAYKRYCWISSNHPHLVFCSVKNTQKLHKCISKLTDSNIKHYQWHEPDLDNALTAIATEPIQGEQRKIFNHYQLFSPQGNQMLTRTTTHKTSFGMYTALDYETYKKLKVIKAVANVSLLRARRFNKVGIRKEHNRHSVPLPHSAFFKLTHGKYYCGYKYDEIAHTVKYLSYPTVGMQEVDGLVGKVLAAWEAAKLVSDESKVVPVDLNFGAVNFDELYETCKSWRNKHLCK